ncbi:MAG: ester cyclase [Dokdonella sp.]
MQADNRALTLRWMEDNWNRRRDAVIEELLDAHAVGYMEGVIVRGPAEFRVARSELLTAFPDVRMDIEAIIAEDDLVAIRWRVSGTHTGAALGLAPSGKMFDAIGSTWLRFANGKIVEGHDTWNQGALMASLAG